MINYRRKNQNLCVLRGYLLEFSVACICSVIIIPNRKSKATIGGAEGAQRPILRVNEVKKTVARSALARTRGRNPLVLC
jgi:hypothetical protein